MRVTVIRINIKVDIEFTSFEKFMGSCKQNENSKQINSPRKNTKFTESGG